MSTSQDISLGKKKSCRYCIFVVLELRQFNLSPQFYLAYVDKKTFFKQVPTHYLYYLFFWQNVTGFVYLQVIYFSYCHPQKFCFDATAK